jgi:hypothetical protein
MSNIIPSTVDAYVERISFKLAEIERDTSKANREWLEIATILAEAKASGIRGKSFKEICRQCRFGYASGTKLVKIANSERIKTYASQLIPRSDSWGTRYPIALMSGSEFRAFCKDHLETNDTQPITRRLVNGFRVNAVKAKRERYALRISQSGKKPSEEEKISLTQVYGWFRNRGYHVIPSEALQKFIEDHPDFLRVLRHSGGLIEQPAGSGAGDAANP